MSECPHLDCAACISAADFLVLEGRLTRDPQFESHALLAMMVYLNRHAIPRSMPEHSAMAAVKQRRNELLANLEPEAIYVMARQCLADQR